MVEKTTSLNSADESATNCVGSVDPNELNNPKINELNNPDVKGFDKPDIDGLDKPDIDGLDKPDVDGLDKPDVDGLDKPDVDGLDKPEVSLADESRGVNVDDVDDVDDVAPDNVETNDDVVREVSADQTDTVSLTSIQIPKEMLQPLTIASAPFVNLSFCGCGFLGIYHLGVANCLIRHGGQLLSKVQRFSGASAGSLVAAATLCATDKIQECIQFCYNLSREVNSKPFGAFTPRYCIMDPLEMFLKEYLPPDAHQLATGKLFISMTTARKKKNVIQSEFSSREELINCLMASSYIPVYGGFRPPVVRGHHFLDGGITDNLPGFREGFTVFVSPFSGRQTISPSDEPGKNWYLGVGCQDFQVNRNNVVRFIHALFPPSKKVLKAYYERGMSDTKKFLMREHLYNDIVTDPSKGFGSKETILDESIRDQVRRLSLPSAEHMRVRVDTTPSTAPSTGGEK